MSKKILITGANGFIAKNLNSWLSLLNYDIDACDKNKLDLLNEVEVCNYLKSKKFDVVVNTSTYDAAPAHSTKDPNMVLNNNLRMFFNLTRCSNLYGKMLYFGSGAEFNRNFWTSRMTEDYFDKHVPEDQYGFSKYVMTKYSLQTNNIYNFRLFCVYGPYNDFRTRFIENAINRVIHDLGILIKQNNKFDNLSVYDLCKIIVWFIENDQKYKVYNICSGEAYTFDQIAGWLYGIAGKSNRSFIQDESGVNYSASNKRILEELGKDFEFVSMYNGLFGLYDWYLKNPINKKLLQKI